MSSVIVCVCVCVCVCVMKNLFGGFLKKEKKKETVWKGRGRKGHKYLKKLALVCQISVCLARIMSHLPARCLSPFSALQWAITAAVDPAPARRAPCLLINNWELHICCLNLKCRELSESVAVGAVHLGKAGLHLPWLRPRWIVWRQACWPFNELRRWSREEPLGEACVCESVWSCSLSWWCWWLASSLSALACVSFIQRGWVFTSVGRPR